VTVGTLREFQSPLGGKLWDVRKGEQKGTVALPKDAMPLAVFSPNSEMFAVLGRTRIILFSATDGIEIAVLQGDASTYRQLFFSADGTRILAHHSSGIDVFDVTGKKSLFRIGVRLLSRAAAVSPDGKSAAIATGDKSAAIYSLESGKLIAATGNHAAEIFDVAYSPDGAILATAGGDWTVKLWDAKSGTMLSDLKAHNNAVMRTAFSPDGKLLCTASWDGTAKLWEVKAVLGK
jgi:WD40 repeat protein